MFLFLVNDLSGFGFWSEAKVCNGVYTPLLCFFVFVFTAVLNRNVKEREGWWGGVGKGRMKWWDSVVCGRDFAMDKNQLKFGVWFYSHRHRTCRWWFNWLVTWWEGLSYERFYFLGGGGNWNGNGRLWRDGDTLSQLAKYRFSCLCVYVTRSRVCVHTHQHRSARYLGL